MPLQSLYPLSASRQRVTVTQQISEQLYVFVFPACRGHVDPLVKFFVELRKQRSDHSDSCVLAHSLVDNLVDPPAVPTGA